MGGGIKWSVGEHAVLTARYVSPVHVLLVLEYYPSTDKTRLLWTFGRLKARFVELVA